MSAANNNLAQVQKNNVKSNEYWLNSMLEMIKIKKSNYVFQNLAKEIETKVNEGTLVTSIRRYLHLPISSTGALTPLVEGVPSTPLKVEAQKVQLTIAQYGNYIEMTDVASVIHFDNIIAEYQPELARIALEEVETKCLQCFSEASTQIVGGKATKADLTATDTLTFKELRKAVNLMKTAHREGHPKYGGKFVAVVHTSVMQDLLDDASLTDTILVPGNENTPMKNGTLDNFKVHGMFIQETLMAKIEQAGSPAFNVYSSYVLGKDSYAVLKLNQKLKWFQTGFTADKSDPLGQKATAGYTQWFGAKVLDPLACIVVFSRSNYDSGYVEANDNIGRPASQA